MNNEPTASGEPSHKAEPVAWIKQSQIMGGCPDLRWNIVNGEGFSYDDNTVKQPDIPLYTHPANTLTDEEIMECWEERDQYANSDYRFNFARAILRKAQEK